jgi:hypothetical protein
MKRSLAVIFTAALGLFFTVSAFPAQLPTGIASVELGDSKKDVYVKILESKHMAFDKLYFPNIPANYRTWWREHEESPVFCRERIGLFGKVFDINWVFGEDDKLHRIELESVATVPSPSEGIDGRKELREFANLVVGRYSEKYGQPSYLKLNSYPEDVLYRYYVAKWSFANDARVEMFVRKECGDFIFPLIFEIHILNTAVRQELKEKAEEVQRKERVCETDFYGGPPVISIHGLEALQSLRKGARR